VTQWAVGHGQSKEECRAKRREKKHRIRQGKRRGKEVEFPTFSILLDYRQWVLIEPFLSTISRKRFCIKTTINVATR